MFDYAWQILNFGGLAVLFFVVYKLARKVSRKYQ